jgi:hypothetical protein
MTVMTHAARPAPCRHAGRRDPAHHGPDQALRGRPCSRGRRLRAPPGRARRHHGRQRSGQVDLRPPDHRGGEAHGRDDLVRRQGTASSRARSTPARRGMECVFQNLALADDLDVPSNLFLGREIIKWNLGPFSILDRKAMRAGDRGGAEAHGGEDPNLSSTIRHMSGGSGNASPSPAPRPSPASSSSWTSPRRRWACRKPRRSRTSSDAQGERRALDPDLPQHAAGLRPRGPDRGVPPGPNRRQPPQGGDGRAGRGRLHHRRQEARTRPPRRSDAAGRSLRALSGEEAATIKEQT